jgi:2-oxoglutarate dehydrogenase E1 component
MEQLFPMPYDRLEVALNMYPNASIHWCQEEHKNGGAWAFIRPRFDTMLKNMKRPKVSYYGRPPAATAAGYGKTHAGELSSLLKDSMS